jgi:hypothetical protein
MPIEDPLFLIPSQTSSYLAQTIRDKSIVCNTFLKDQSIHRKHNLGATLRLTVPSTNIHSAIGIVDSNLQCLPTPHRNATSALGEDLTM